MSNDPPSKPPNGNVPASANDLARNRAGASLRKLAAEMIEKETFLHYLRRSFSGHSQHRAWRRGAEGEEVVAKCLTPLEEAGWKVLHSVPIGEGEADIDHVVIGPSGVFTVNTKNHRGKRVTVYEHVIYVSGVKVPYIQKARGEGKRATQRLSRALGKPIVVKPLIVVLARDFRVKGHPNGVTVVPRRQIASWLSKQSPVMSREEMAAVYDVARQRATWTSR